MDRSDANHDDETETSATDPLSGCPSSGDLLAVGPEPPIQTSHHTLTLLPGMNAVLEAIGSDVERAHHRIAIETYIYRDDALGRGFGDILARAVARGVSTRLLYDPLGSQETDPAFFDELRGRGIDVRAYRADGIIAGPMASWPRDHSRVIVIDDAAYTGGAAWGDEWLPKERGGKGWHDVCLRVHGPCVEDFAHLFEQRWREAITEIKNPLNFSTGNKYPDLELVGDTPDRDSRVYDRYRQAIQRSRTRVWIENAYFFPPPALLKDLFEAVERGVDVRVILPKDSDLPILKRAARSEFSLWIERGLRVFEYAQCMLHSKFAVIDGDWCTVGTFNANPTSVGFANEVNVFVFDAVFVERVARLFEADLEDSEEVTDEALAQRPLLDQALDQLANDTLNLIDIVAGPPSDPD